MCILSIICNVTNHVTMHCFPPLWWTLLLLNVSQYHSNPSLALVSVTSAAGPSCYCVPTNTSFLFWVFNYDFYSIYFTFFVISVLFYSTFVAFSVLLLCFSTCWNFHELQFIWPLWPTIKLALETIIVYVYININTYSCPLTKNFRRL